MLAIIASRWEPGYGGRHVWRTVSSAPRPCTRGSASSPRTARPPSRRSSADRQGRCSVSSPAARDRTPQRCSREARSPSVRWASRPEGADRPATERSEPTSPGIRSAAPSPWIASRSHARTRSASMPKRHRPGRGTAATGTAPRHRGPAMCTIDNHGPKQAPPAQPGPTVLAPTTTSSTATDPTPCTPTPTGDWHLSQPTCGRRLNVICPSGRGSSGSPARAGVGPVAVAR